MDQVKILHCADVHLGADLSALGRKAAARRAEVKMTFMTIIRLCLEEQIQLLLIPGDMFNDVHVPDTLVLEVRDAFASIPDTIVAIAPGNHDPMTQDSPYMKKDFWPENVRIFGGPWESRIIEKLGVRLWGAAFQGGYTNKSILPSAQTARSSSSSNSHASDPYINIGILHGDLVAPGQQSNYNPVSEAQIAASKLDYLALGHVHKRSGVQKADGTYYAYPGCPEGGGFDELEDKGVLIGTVAKGWCDIQYRRVCQRMNLELRIDISEAENSGNAATLILARMEELHGPDYADHLYKLILEGSLPDSVFIDFAEIATALGHLYYVKIIDHTEVSIDLGAVAADLSMKGIFVRKMQEKLADTDDEKKEKWAAALRLGLKAFIGEVGYRED